MSHCGVFITWNDSRRSVSLSTRFELRRVLIVGGRRGTARHLIGSTATLSYLLRHRPTTIWFQYSWALALVLWLYARALPRIVHLVADVHTKAMRREGPRGIRWLIRAVKRRSLRACAMVLVTNEDNASYMMQAFGVSASLLPDPLPSVPLEYGPEGSASARCETRRNGRRRADVAFVCSFAEDEPIALMIEAARELSATLRVVFTGDPASLSRSMVGEINGVAELTGFVSEPEYWRLLASTPCVVVLSNERACVPCGAYEAIAVGRRPLLADDPENRRVFGGLARYVELRRASLAAAIRDAVGVPPPSRDPGLASCYERRWQIYRQRMADGLAGPCATMLATHGTMEASPHSHEAASLHERCWYVSSKG